jgi:hypothetical protein
MTPSKRSTRLEKVEATLDAHYLEPDVQPAEAAAPKLELRTKP